jgi:hypothetical protein
MFGFSSHCRSPLSFCVPCTHVNYPQTANRDLDQNHSACVLTWPAGLGQHPFQAGRYFSYLAARIFHEKVSATLIAYAFAALNRSGQAHGWN